MILHLFERAFRLMKKVPIKGAFVEFGVYKGEGSIHIIKMAQRLSKYPKFFGFDSFEGMPKTKMPLASSLKISWAENTFSDTSINLVRELIKKRNLKGTFIKGVFSKLKPLSSYGISKIRFIYLDADIYEGYRDALRLITPCIQIGTVIIFDEYFAPSDHRYQSIRQHGTKAIREWEDETGINLHLIRFKWSGALCVVVDEPYLKKYGRFIESLRADNIIQSMMDALHQISHSTILLIKYLHQNK